MTPTEALAQALAQALDLSGLFPYDAPLTSYATTIGSAVSALGYTLVRSEDVLTLDDAGVVRLAEAMTPDGEDPFEMRSTAREIVERLGQGGGRHGPCIPVNEETVERVAVWYAERRYASWAVLSDGARDNMRADARALLTGLSGPTDG